MYQVKLSVRELWSKRNTIDAFQCALHMQIGKRANNIQKVLILGKASWINHSNCRVRFLVIAS